MTEYKRQNRLNENNYHDQIPYSDSDAYLDRLDHPISPIESYKASYLVYVAVLCAQMSSIGMGSTYGWSAPALEELYNNYWPDSPFKPSDSAKGWIASILTVGALFGGMICGMFRLNLHFALNFYLKPFFHKGFCTDYFGRKKTLIGIGVPYIVGWLLIGLGHFFSSGFKKISSF